MTSAAPITRRPSLAIYLPDLSGGGAERLHINLAPSFVAAGYDVTFLLDRRRGELLTRVPEGCSVAALDAPRQLKAVVALARYLRSTPPDILVANMEHMNIMALAARTAARAKTRIVATQHNTVSEQAKRPSWQFRILRPLYRAFLHFSDAVVAVSAGVADDLARFARLGRDRIEVIYNGVIEPDHAERAARPPAHPWLAEGAPVIVAAGRLTEQKDFQTLLKALAQVDSAPPAKLLLLGEGPLRSELETLAGSLGLAERVAMPGFEADPLPALRAARLLVLSSRFEGFGNVIAEALGCGTPVVSTDCPHGPAEILAHGRYGRLVPVGDSEAMARAIEQTLGEDHDREDLIARSMNFTVGTCASAYLAIFDRVLGTDRRD